MLSLCKDMVMNRLTVGDSKGVLEHWELGDLCIKSKVEFGLS